MPNSWFIDENHVVLPVVRHRLCIDYFLSYAAYGFVLITFLWATVATLLAAGVSIYFLVSAILSLLILPWVSYGEWAITNRAAGHVYTYSVCLFWMSLGLIWSGSAGYLHIRQGKEVIEETWYTLQTQVFPFTTQLDQKNSLESSATAIFGLAIVSGLLMFLGVGDGWKALGGNFIMLNMRWAWALPEGVTVMLLASSSAGYATYGATVSAWATPNAGGVQAQLWHAATSILVFVLGVGQLVLPAVWGPASVLVHAVLAVGAAIPAFVLFVTSFVLQRNALSVDGWVQANWESLQQFVPEKFQGLAWDKYAEACYTPMKEAALSGLMLSIILMCSALYHAQTGAVVWSVGPQLSIARIRLQDQHVRIMNATSSGLPMIIPSGSMLGEGEGGSAFEGGSDAVQDWNGSRAGIGTSGVGKASFIPIPVKELSRFGAAALMRATDPTAVASPLRGALGGAYKGYGAVSTSGEDPLTEPLSGRYTDEDSPSASSTQAATGLHHRVAAAANAANKDAGMLQMPTPIAVQVPADFPGGGTGAAEARARVAAMQQYQLMVLTYDKQVAAIGKKATWPSMKQWGQTLREEILSVAKPYAAFLVVSAIIMLSVIIGTSVGLMKVTSATKCGVLGYAPATATYSTWFQLESFGKRGYSNVYIDHSFPFGSVQIIALRAEGFPDTLTRNMTVDITAYAASGRNLPSAATLASMVNISTTCNGRSADDDDEGGCLGVNIVVSPGVSWQDAREQCLGLQLTINTVVPALFYTVRTRSALLNISGNSKQLVDAIVAGGGKIVPIPNTMQSLNIQSDTGAIVADGIYSTLYGQTPPNLDASLVINSAAGNVFLKNTVAQAANVKTGGRLQVVTLLSASTSCLGICGDVSLATTGNAPLTISKLVAAYSLNVSSVHGSITAVNTAMDVALDILISSVDGAVVMSNFIQLHSNRTVVRTGGSVSATAVFANVLDIGVTGNSKVSITEGFLGLPKPVTDDGSDPCASGDIPVNPAFGPIQNYSYPALIVSTERGDVSIIGIGGDPRSETNSLTDSLYVTSVTGQIKVQVSGNGINANYTLVSTQGKTVVEIDGLAAGPSGKLGSGSDATAGNAVYLFSRDGDVTMSLLASPL